MHIFIIYCRLLSPHVHPVHTTVQFILSRMREGRTREGCPQIVGHPSTNEYSINRQASALRTEGELELVELFGSDGGRTARHDVATTVVLGEGNEVADAVGTTKEGAETVETEGETGMWRRTIGKGVHQEAELGSSALVGKAQGVEHLVLQGTVVNTDTATTDFHTIDDDVVGIGADVAPTCGVVKESLVLRLGSGEGVVHGVVALRLLVPLEQREIHDP